MISATSSTKISSWGNSDAVRIPRSLLKLAGLASGDGVTIVLNERNNIEIVPRERSHRRVKPLRGITFESLTAGWNPDERQPKPNSAWPDDDLVGAEFKAWSR